MNVIRLVDFILGKGPGKPDGNGIAIFEGHDGREVHVFSDWHRAQWWVGSINDLATHRHLKTLLDESSLSRHSRDAPWKVDQPAAQVLLHLHDNFGVKGVLFEEVPGEPGEPPQRFEVAPGIESMIYTDGSGMAIFFLSDTRTGQRILTLRDSVAMYFAGCVRRMAGKQPRNP